MTTTVKIEAHCSNDKEVRVNIIEGTDVQTHVLQNGESKEWYAYDDREIRVREVLKE